MKKFNLPFNAIITLSCLLFLVFLSMWVRMSTFGARTVLDYDPFWQYRHAKEILENNFRAPEWDSLSFFPPGRPNYKSQGWNYTMALFFKIASLFISVPFMEIAKIAPVIMAGLAVVSAYLLGKFLTNKWGGLATGLFATLTPTFIGVSMAGYCDTDATVVFYFFLSVYSIFLALKKRSKKGSIPYYVLAILANVAFVYNWGAGWFPLMLFIAFLPVFVVFRIIENIIHQKKLKIDIKTTITELKPFIVPLLIISIGANAIAFFLGTSNIFSSILVGLRFTGIAGTPMLVNVSVAELQLINILTKSGFFSVAGRVGLLPTLMTLFGLPILVLYKLIKKTKINYAEIFLYVCALITFYLILRGVRFSLLFSCATAASTGYVIGSLVKHLKRNIISATVFGVLTLLALMFVSDAIQIGYAGAGMELSGNWYDLLDWLKENADKKALVATWWDPGHIITGYAGLRVHADGAHCSPFDCIPYNHNIRIQNMGKIMSTSDESEAVDILKKYMQLTPEQCEEVKQNFGDIVPEEACESVSEMYFISSNDLIGKFTWMNYFPWVFNLKDVQQDDQGNPIYVYDYSGLTMSLVQKQLYLLPIYNNQYLINHVTFFSDGQMQDIDLSDSGINLEKIDGLVWVDPSFRSLIYFSPAIKDSVFTKTFFYDGKGLEHFELIYSNPEIKLYKVNFD